MVVTFPYTKCNYYYWTHVVKELLLSNTGSKKFNIITQHGW